MKYNELVDILLGINKKTRLLAAISITISVIMLVVPFYNFGDFNSVYLGYEVFDPRLFLKTWHPENFGTFGYLFIPYDIFIWAIFQIVPAPIANISSFVIPQIIAFAGIFILVNSIFKQKIIAVISAFFYVYSIYAQFMSGWPIHSGSMAYALLPIFIYLFLTVQHQTIKPVLAKLTLLQLLLININLTYVAYVYFCIFCVYVYRITTEKTRQTLVTLSTTLITTFVAYLLINSPFLFTFISQNSFDKSLLSNSIASESIDWKSSGSNLSEVIREMGSVNFTYKYNNRFAYPNARPYFENDLFIVLSYYPALIFVIALLLRHKNHIFEKNFVTTIYIIMIFLALGVNSTSPFSIIYRLMAEHVPYFKIFRDSYKATVVIHLIYTLAIGYVGFWLLNQKSKLQYLYYLYLIIVTSCITILSLTYWQGKFFTAETINIPNYWHKMQTDYTKDYEATRILMTPKMEFPVYTFVNKPTGHSTFYRPLLNFNMINPNSVFRYSDTTNQIYKSLNQETLGLYNVQLILNQYDVHWRLYKSTNPKQIGNKLEQNGYTLIKHYE